MSADRIDKPAVWLDFIYTEKTSENVIIFNANNFILFSKLINCQ